MTPTYGNRLERAYEWLTNPIEIASMGSQGNGDAAICARSRGLCSLRRCCHRRRLFKPKTTQPFSARLRDRVDAKQHSPSCDMQDKTSKATQRKRLKFGGGVGEKRTKIRRESRLHPLRLVVASNPVNTLPISAEYLRESALVQRIWVAYCRGDEVLEKNLPKQPNPLKKKP